MTAAPEQSFEHALHALLHTSVLRLMHDASPGPYLDWIARYGPSIGPGLLPPQAREREQAAEASRLMRLFGHMIYAMLPLPQHGFQTRSIPLPSADDACMCGSLRKYSQCCAPLLETLPKLSPELAMPHVLGAIGKAAWKTLPQQGIAPRLVEAAAEWFRLEQRPKDVVALLEPWAAQPGRYPDAWAGLLDLLGDAYAELDKPRKRRSLARAMIERGESAVQSKGWQRRCLIATDAGRRAEAAEAFAQAQRLAPDEPGLALLELSMLLGFGDTTHAAERAQFHIRRISRMNADGRHDELILALREMGERGQHFVEDVSLRHDPGLARLTAWAGALPPPQLRVDLSRCSAKNLGELANVPPLAQAVARWMRLLMLPPADAHGAAEPDGDPWGKFHAWMPALEREPELADTFEVLDGLGSALLAHPSPGAAAASRYVMERSLALWAMLRERFPQAACEWAGWANRPALRLLARYIASDSSDNAASTFDWLRHMVEVLNPRDDHGLRSRLAFVLLRRGLYGEALALCDRYPHDMDKMMLARVLALWHGAQRDAAAALLADTLRGNPKLARVMRSPRLPQPRAGELITAGSLVEAQLAYAEQWDLWQDLELRQMLMEVSRR